MPAATRTDSVLNTLPLTQSSILNALKTALANAGFPSTIYDDQISANQYFVSQIVLDSNRVKGTAYMKFSCSPYSGNFILNQQIFDGWNATTHTGTNGGVNAGFNPQINPNIAISFSAFNHPEVKLVVLYQSATTINVVGYLRPVNKYSWWSEDESPFIFCPANESIQTFYTCANNPYGNTTIYFSLGTRQEMQYRNPKNAKRDIKPSPDIYSPTNEGIAATFGSDIVIGSTNGTNRLDTITVSPTEVYTILFPASYAGFCLRTT